MNRFCLFLVLTASLCLNVDKAQAFLPQNPSVFYYTTPSSCSPLVHHRSFFASIALAAKRKKESMAAKRKRRAQATQKRLQQMETAKSELPPSKLDFKTPPKPPTPTGVSTENNVDDEATTQKAKALVEAQRESVKMLTHVANQVAAIDLETLVESLDNRGYFVVDDFLKDDEIVNVLQKESEDLYQNNEMTADASNLGIGEFIVAIEGGNEQYPKCPRSIELIFSLTSKLSARFNSDDGFKEKVVTLDDRACSNAVARLFNRSALKASLQLLLGVDDDMDQALENLKPPPFQTVIEKDKLEKETEESTTNDLRKISICYYAVPSRWGASLGGGVSFEGGSTVEAKRNRLVIWKSDTTPCRREPFRGSDDVSLASCFELNLVHQKQ